MSLGRPYSRVPQFATNLGKSAIKPSLLHGLWRPTALQLAGLSAVNKNRYPTAVSRQPLEIVDDALPDVHTKATGPSMAPPGHKSLHCARQDNLSIYRVDCQNAKAIGVLREPGDTTAFCTP